MKNKWDPTNWAVDVRAADGRRETRVFDDPKDAAKYEAWARAEGHQAALWEM